MNSVRYRDIISGTRRSPGATAARVALLACEPIYRLAVAARNASFDMRLRAPVRLPRPVVSIGNLTTGGTGKTPMVVLVAERLKAIGCAPAVLLRGYRSSGGLSDEATLLTDELSSDVPVEANPDRVAGARTVIARHDHIDAFVLDDGFQHRQVRRDLDIVLIDATEPWGFGHVLPRGLLREPRRNLRRADAVIVTRADQVDDTTLGRIDQAIERLTGQPPVGHASHRWTGLVGRSDQAQPLDVLAPLEVYAAAGVGNGAAFVASLAQHTRAVAGQCLYPDHHAYSCADLDAIVGQAQRCGARAVVTTAKDWVKWRALRWPDDAPMPVYRPVLRLELLDGADALAELLARAVGAGT